LESQDTLDRHSEGYHNEEENSHEEHENSSQPSEENAGAPEDKCSNEDEDPRYPFSDNKDSLLASRAMRVVPSLPDDEIIAHATKASKPTETKPKVVESNCVCYKVGSGPQPTHDKHLQRCIEVSVPVNRLRACVLLDGGSNTNMVSPEFATVAKIPAIELQDQMTLQLVWQNDQR
jgi:hypothetical protein